MAKRAVFVDPGKLDLEGIIEERVPMLAQEDEQPGELDETDAWARPVVREMGTPSKPRRIPRVNPSSDCLTGVLVARATSIPERGLPGRQAPRLTPALTICVIACPQGLLPLNRVQMYSLTEYSRNWS